MKILHSLYFKKGKIGNILQFSYNRFANRIILCFKECLMKYFFILLSMFLASPSVFAGKTEPIIKKSTRLNKNVSEAEQTMPVINELASSRDSSEPNLFSGGPDALEQKLGIKSGLNMTYLSQLNEANREKIETVNAEDSHVEDSQKKDSLSRLKNTELAEAIITGDIEKYEKALSDLTSFDLSLPGLMEYTDLEGNTLLDLMIKTKENREYFNQQVLNILTLLFNKQNNPWKVQLDPTGSVVAFTAKVNNLLLKAESAGNTQAVQMLRSIKTMFQYHEENFISNEEHRFKMKSAVEQLKKQTPSVRSIALQALVSTTGIVLGYRLVTNASLPMLDFTNLFLPTDWAITPVHIAGAALLGVGGEYAVRAFKSCKKAFQNRKTIKQLL